MAGGECGGGAEGIAAGSPSTCSRQASSQAQSPRFHSKVCICSSPMVCMAGAFVSNGGAAVVSRQYPSICRVLQVVVLAAGCSVAVLPGILRCIEPVFYAGIHVVAAHRGLYVP